MAAATMSPAALLWPLSRETFRLLFGVLPSAGWPKPSNPLFYRNLLIEIGVLVPLCTSVLVLRRESLSPGRRALLLGGLGLISLVFMAWAASLSR